MAGPRLRTRLLLLALSTVLALGVAEVVLRMPLAEGTEPRAAPVYDRHRSSMWRPDFRDRGEPGSKPPGTFRILAVGDSFTWGYGVHPRDAWPDRLGEALHGRSTPIEVVNWSRPGWNTVEEWRATRGELGKLDPDLLLLGFCLNDPEGSGRERRAEHDTMQLRDPPGGMAGWLIGSSRLAELVWGRWAAQRRTFAVHAYHRSLYEPSDNRKACFEALEGFRDWAERSRVPAILVVFPIFERSLGHGYPYPEIHEQMRRVGAEMRFPVFDLLEAYRGMDGRRLAVDPPRDPHPNELAHRMAADAIREHLDESGLLPPEGNAPTE